LEKGERVKPDYDRVVVEDDGLGTITVGYTDRVLLHVDNGHDINSFQHDNAQICNQTFTPTKEQAFLSGIFN
jgi:hypothetical protein